MILEEVPLVLQRERDGPLVLDVALAAVDDRHVAQAQRDDAAGQNIHDVRPFVHQVHLGQHADGPLALRIDLARQLQAVRVGQVRVGGRDGQDDGVGLHDLLQHHVLDLPLDVFRLVAHGHFRQAGKIDEGEGQHVG